MMLANAIRGAANEFRLTVPKGIRKLDDLIMPVDADEIIPQRAKHTIAGVYNYCTT
jgi:hypothetical protein